MYVPSDEETIEHKDIAVLIKNIVEDKLSELLKE